MACRRDGLKWIDRSFKERSTFDDLSNGKTSFLPIFRSDHLNSYWKPVFDHDGRRQRGKTQQNNSEGFPERKFFAVGSHASD